jgi:hypothetical protein
MRAEQINFHLAGFIVGLRNHAQLDGITFQAPHVESPERAVGRRPGRLIIFPAHEIAGGIHPHNLPGRQDKGCPRSCAMPNCKSTSAAASGVCHENPNGIPSSSPALTRSGYAGFRPPKQNQPQRGCILFARMDSTLSGLPPFCFITRRSPISSANAGLDDSIPSGLGIVCRENPNGIPSSSPGLRGTSYPG